MIAVVFGVMVASQAGRAVPVPLGDVAGNLKTVPLDDPWIAAARGFAQAVVVELEQGGGVAGQGGLQPA